MGALDLELMNLLMIEVGVDSAADFVVLIVAPFSVVLSRLAVGRDSIEIFGVNFDLTFEA